MAKYKAGLHKRISAIFGGVSFSKNDNTRQTPPAFKKENPDSASPKLPTVKGLFSSSSSPQQTTQLSPEVSSSKQPAVTGTAVKNFRQAFGAQCWKQIKNKLFTPKAGIDANRHKAMVILAPVLFVIFIFVIVRVLNQPSPAAAHTIDSGSANVGNSVAAASERKVNWQIPELYPTTLRDPMQASLSAGGQGGSGNLVVKGIVYSENHPSAIVDDQIVHQGDKILGVAAVKINKNSVEFEMNGKKWTQEVQR
jgi:hypothetical protein